MSSLSSDLSELFSDKKNTAPDYNAQSLFTVRNASQLLADPTRSSYLKKIKELVAMPDEHFDVLYTKLVDNFVEFAQLLPIQYREHLSGIMQEGLRHALIALQILFETSPTKPQPIYIYAVFSMALLADLVKVIATQKVMVSDENGIYIDEWCPFTGSLIEQGAQFYKIREYGGYREAFLNSANPLLAQKVMPELGLRWLASHPRIFDMWIAVLTGHEDWAGDLGLLKKLLRRYLSEKEKEMQFWLENIPMDFTVPEDVAIGEKFLEWLKDGLENETISVNEKDSFVHILDEGVFIETPDVYDAFNHVYSSYRDFIVLQKQFNYLGVSKLSGYDFKFEQFFAVRGDAAARLGFLTHHNNDMKVANLAADAAAKLAGEMPNQVKISDMKGQLLSQPVSTSKKSLQGLLVSDPAILYGSGSIPAASKEMKDVSVSYMQDNQLPKLQNKQPNQQQTQQATVTVTPPSHSTRR